MAKLNLDYYTAKDHYSDGDIENTLLEMGREGKSFQDLPEDEVSFPMVYHFSDLRENILNWYPLKKTDSVLEIGAGCGAITGMLCQKAGKVTSVELSRRRAEINFARNSEKENLTIMVGNLNDMTFPESFDYVVVNGVLEYAMSFTEGETPYETFLQEMGGYLKPEGKLLIAIENRLGLKYFAGAPEDHTDIHFFGIDGYPGNHSVRTFSKEELGELLKNSGFPFLHFFCPYHRPAVSPWLSWNRSPEPELCRYHGPQTAPAYSHNAALPTPPSAPSVLPGSHCKRREAEPEWR